VVTFERVEIELLGPVSTGMGSPNPFLIEVQVIFNGPSGQIYTVPAFYDGDGNGSMNGNVWKARFAPESPGSWSYLSTSSNALLNGQTGAFEAISPSNCQVYAPGGLPDFACQGRLEYDGTHYLKFSNGGYWIKGGLDDPENFLGSAFGDWNAKKAAVDYLASKGVNSVYLITNNVGGDREDTWPWVGETSTEAMANSDHFNVAKLLLWEDFFTYVQEKGIVLHIVLDDDSAWDGYDHFLYYREMIARFSHHPGIIWNIGEEANEIYTDEEQIAHANTIRSLDIYDHPITVQRLPAWPFFGGSSFDLTSIQLINGALEFSVTDLGDLNALVISHWNLSGSAGRPIAIMIDEIPRVTVVDEAAILKMRTEVLYPIFLGGGGHELHFFDAYRPGGTVTIEMLEPMLLDMQRARQFLESLPFSLMLPCNQLLSPAGNLCRGKAGEVYAFYISTGGSINMDLSGEEIGFNLEWFDPRSGTVIDGGVVEAGGIRALTAPDSQDWALTLRSLSELPSPTVTTTDTSTPTETVTITVTPTGSSTPTPTVTSTPPPCLCSRRAFFLPIVIH
jgi:hypothetical protein